MVGMLEKSLGKTQEGAEFEIILDFNARDKRQVRTAYRVNLKV